MNAAQHSDSRPHLQLGALCVTWMDEKCRAVLRVSESKTAIEN